MLDDVKLFSVVKMKAGSEELWKDLTVLSNWE